MNISNSVIEDSAQATTLQVFHRLLRIPLQKYLDSVAEFTDPWDERAYQHFVQVYLDELDDPGIVGMVRQERDSDYVYLDAAIRYPNQPNPPQTSPFKNFN